MPVINNVWAPRIGNSISVEEKHDSVKVTTTLDSIECEVTLIVPWADRHQIAFDLMGMYESYVNGNDDPQALFGGQPRYQPTYWPYMNVRNNEPQEYIKTSIISSNC